MKQPKFTALYKEYSRQLYNFIRWTTNYCPVCDDILQNMFIRVWRCESVPENDVECRRWLYAIARNACIDYFRSSARFSNFSEKYNKEYSNSNALEEQECDNSEIWKELAKLSDIDRSILYLHIKEGYAYGEIAGMLDLNENQVRVKAFRALKKLREELVRTEV
jgi:RNA polymerase sigma-70 factor (ECF subfamily)